MEGVLSKIASSSHSRTNDDWLDTVMGYHSGNWTFEWIKLGMDHQKRANEMQGEEAADELFTASLCFSIAGYPHLKNDNLASQAQVLANKAYSDGAEKKLSTPSSKLKCLTKIAKSSRTSIYQERINSCLW